MDTNPRKMNSATLHKTVPSTFSLQGPKDKRLAFQEQGKETQEEMVVSKMHNWHSCPMHGVQWEHREGKGGKRERQLHGGSGIFNWKDEKIGTNGAGGREGNSHQGETPVPIP